MLQAHYPHVQIDKLWVYRLLFVCLLVWLRISPLRIKLEVSNFARRFMGVQGREFPVFVNFPPQKPQIGRIGQRMKDDDCTSYRVVFTMLAASIGNPSVTV